MVFRLFKSARFSFLFLAVLVSANFAASAFAAEPEKQGIVLPGKQGNYFWFGGKDIKDWYTPANEKQGSYDEINVTNGGTINGRLVFKGQVPKIAPVQVGNPMGYCGTESDPESLVVGDGGGVKYGIAFLAKVPKGKPVDYDMVNLVEAVGCTFSPHVVAMTKGAVLSGINKDQLEHDIDAHVDDSQKLYEVLLIDGGSKAGKIHKTGFMEITCDLHNNMRAWGMVFPHPYFAVTDGSGNFTIDKIPPGKYTLKMWHENWKSLGKDNEGRLVYEPPVLLTKEIEIKAGATEQVEFTLEP